MFYSNRARSLARAIGFIDFPRSERVLASRQTRVPGQFAGKCLESPARAEDRKSGRNGERRLNCHRRRRRRRRLNMNHKRKRKDNCMLMGRPVCTGCTSRSGPKIRKRPPRDSRVHIPDVTKILPIFDQPSTYVMQS